MYKLEQIKTLTYEELDRGWPLGITPYAPVIWAIWADLQTSKALATKARMKLVNDNGFNLLHIKNPSRTVVRAAMRKTPWLVKYMNVEDEDEQLWLLRQRKRGLYRYFINPSEDVKIAHVQNYYKNLADIDDPQPELIELAIERFSQNTDWFFTHFGHLIPTWMFVANMNRWYRYFDKLVDPPFDLTLAYTRYVRHVTHENESYVHLREFFEYLKHVSPKLTYEQKVDLFKIYDRSMFGFGYDSNILIENSDYIRDVTLTKLFAGLSQSDEALVAVLRNC
jgi:hypothetical protein